MWRTITKFGLALALLIGSGSIALAGNGETAGAVNKQNMYEKSDFFAGYCNEFWTSGAAYVGNDPETGIKEAINSYKKLNLDTAAWERELVFYRKLKNYITFRLISDNWDMSTFNYGMREFISDWERFKISSDLYSKECLNNGGFLKTSKCDTLKMLASEPYQRVREYCHSASWLPFQ